MRLRKILNGLLIFSLILFLGMFLPCGNMLTAYAGNGQDIKLNVNSQTIVKGKNFSIYVYNLSEDQEVTFVSSDPAIASVDEYGVVTGNLIGTATILVTITEGEDTVDILSCDIKVGPPAISVQFSRLELAMKVGQKLTLERIILPLNTAETAKFSSYNRAIATVSAGGRVTAKTEGFTYIFAQLDNGRFAVCKVNIYPKDTPDDVFEALVQRTLKTVVIPAEDVTDTLTEEIPDTEGTEISEPETSEVTTEETAFIEPLEDIVSEEIMPEESEEETTEQEISDPFLLHSEDMDFETFIKELNAALKASENAESSNDDAN
jgi:hypothetical protein